MLNDLQRLFKDTWNSFRTELGRREPEDQVAELLSMMRREMVGARAELPALDESVSSAERELERERIALGDCERRARLASGIGDQETVRVAEEFAARHRERVGVLEQKVAAARAERELRRREVEEMSARYKAADANRLRLVADLRRQKAAGTVRDALEGSGGAFGDFARMEEAVERDADYVDALDELSDRGPEMGRQQAPPVPDVDARLEELKRRMGKS
jgi:phage shock protein A